MQDSSSTSGSKLLNIPQHLRIRVLHSDGSIVVIHKPSLLRSVPGNSKCKSDVSNHGNLRHSNDRHDQYSSGGRARGIDGDEDKSVAKHENGYSHSRSIQDTWVEAIRFYQTQRKAEECISRQILLIRSSSDKTGNRIKSDVTQLRLNAKTILTSLATKPDHILRSISRKSKSFQKYVSKNVKRILPHLMKKKKDWSKGGGLQGGVSSTKEEEGIKMNDIMLNEAAEVAYNVLRHKSTTLHTQYSSSKRTKEEESALGQLQLIDCLSQKSSNNDKDVLESITKLYGPLPQSISQQESLHVVHRLDCETSGVMVFARTRAAASKLCQVWRERDAVSKIYLARVKHWPPYEEDGKESGMINLPLAPVKDERLKWQVMDVEEGGKPCETEWRVMLEEGDQTKGGPFTLELKPVTGRTHQLRVHCAAVGSGIIGDSLYGDQPFDLRGQDFEVVKRHLSLRLHAWKLSFPHPLSEEQQIKSFQCEHSWI